MLPQVNVIHINKGDGIPVLIVIESNGDLVKYQLNIKAWGVFVQLMVHDDLGKNRWSNKIYDLSLLTLPSPETGLKIN